jgi:hypothetical protein
MGHDPPGRLHPTMSGRLDASGQKKAPPARADGALAFKFAGPTYLFRRYAPQPIPRAASRDQTRKVEGSGMI